MNMMRASNPAASMQKTYDDCYLICSTAIYFEKQNNEEEALRSWREALDQIYYHNAYKIPANYRGKTEVERALQDSLRTLEMQCKERVDLLEGLRKSREVKPRIQIRSPFVLNRKDSNQTSDSNSISGPYNNGMGNGTVPPLEYDAIPRQAIKPATPTPMMAARQVTEPLRPAGILPDTRRVASSNTLPIPPSHAPQKSRSPSPDKKSSVFKSSLRSGTKEPSKFAASMRPPPGKPAVAAKAATLAWPSRSNSTEQSGPTNAGLSRNDSQDYPRMSEDVVRPFNILEQPRRALSNEFPHRPAPPPLPNTSQPRRNDLAARGAPAQSGPQVRSDVGGWLKAQKSHPTSPVQTQAAVLPPYRTEYPAPAPINPHKVPGFLGRRNRADGDNGNSPTSPPSPRNKGISVLRKAVGSGTPKAQPKQLPSANVMANATRQPHPGNPAGLPSAAARGALNDGMARQQKRPARPQGEEPLLADAGGDGTETPTENAMWDARIKKLMKNLPRGVDEQAAKSIFNEIVIHGDEVHWDDVAGLDIAKNALKEAVVYPFLRPDLFMGLREPARGMLLFGPPGTGKTMLARAVATESKSTFFAISASSLTSKYLGESEKLVRALFGLAKALTPAIIFVDEIDSLLSARAGSGEHEATRRIKTEFLIQWSDLAKAAAGKEQTEGDASRVLVLAATNLPWAIDEAARRRFVRRQYIPLPEAPVRNSQLRKLMSAQKHNMKDRDFAKLVQLTDGFSGSDITALAKDAAMGPLRALGEKLLNMTPDSIRPIALQDFEASLVNIRPSVGKAGLKEYEQWAKEFGERGG